MKWPKHIFLLAVLFVCACADAEELDTYLRNKGLVDISAQDSTIRVQLVYATPDNFMGEAVYSGITRAWLHPDAAGKLVAAQRLLKKKIPTLRWLFMMRPGQCLYNVKCGHLFAEPIR